MATGGSDMGACEGNEVLPGAEGDPGVRPELPPRTLEWTHHPSPVLPPTPYLPQASLQTLIHWLK